MAGKGRVCPLSIMFLLCWWRIHFNFHLYCQFVVFSIYHVLFFLIIYVPAYLMIILKWVLVLHIIWFDLYSWWGYYGTPGPQKLEDVFLCQLICDKIRSLLSALRYVIVTCHIECRPLLVDVFQALLDSCNHWSLTGRVRSRRRRGDEMTKSDEIQLNPFITSKYMNTCWKNVLLSITVINHYNEKGEIMILVNKSGYACVWLFSIDRICCHPATIVFLLQILQELY